MIIESRISQENITQGKNTHELVISRLSELWDSESEKSKELFEYIGLLIAQYENPNPVISYTFGEWILRASKNGKRVIVAKSRNKNIIQLKLQQFCI